MSSISVWFEKYLKDFVEARLEKVKADMKDDCYKKQPRQD